MARRRAALIGRGFLRPALAIGPVAFLAVFFVWPLVAILDLGLRPTGRLDLSRMADVVTDETVRGVVVFTLWQAALSTMATLAVGLPIAYVTHRYRFRGRALLRTVVMAPFVLPTLVVAGAFLALVGPSGASPVRLDGTVALVVVAHVFFNVAVVVRIVGAAWATLDPRPTEAAATLGAGPIRRTLEITGRALAPAITAAAAVVYLFCFTSFGIVLVLGGPRLATLETEIYERTAVLLDLPTAAALAVVQVLLVAALVVSVGRIEEWLSGPRAERSAVVNELPVDTRSRRAALGAVLVTVVLLVLTPLAALLWRSVRVPGGVGLANWRALGDTGTSLAVPPAEAIVNSLRFAAIATVIALAVGSLAALAITRTRRRALGAALDLALMLPLGVSAVTLGFGFVVGLDEPPVDFRGRWWLVPVAQALVAVPFVLRILVPLLRSIDPRLREAAAVLGASPGRVWREIDLVLLSRGVAVAGGFAFAISLGEFGATTFIARADQPTVPVAIARLLGRPGPLNQGQAMALAVVLLVLCGVSIAAMERLRRRW